MTLVVVRHASAGDRDRWAGDDRLRPLDKKGRRQAEALREILLACGVTRALSSPYVRCVQTLEPLGLGVEPDDRLAEGAAVRATLDLLRDADGAVACTHGDVIENVLGLALKKAAGVVLDGLEIVKRIDAP